MQKKTSLPSNVFDFLLVSKFLLTPTNQNNNNVNFIIVFFKEFLDF